MNCVWSIIDAHCFETERNLARDFAGNLDSISVMRSVGKESEIIIVVVAEYIESGGEI